MANIMKYMNFCTEKELFLLFLCKISYICEPILHNMTKNPLRQFGQVPIQMGALVSCFPNLSSPEKKILALEKSGELIRLKRGLYVVNEQVSGKPIDSRLCANHIYGPSYVSMQWALRWYGLIPERVFTMTSVTTKRTRMFDTGIGSFSYFQVPPNYFPIGVQMNEANGCNSLIASPEKALCDTILSDNYVPEQSLIRLAKYLEEDLRFDTDALKDFDASIIEACANAGRKTAILNNLLKLINQ